MSSAGLPTMNRVLLKPAQAPQQFLALIGTLAALQPASCSIYRWQHPNSNIKPRNVTGPTGSYTQSDNAEQHLKQIEKLEKQLFAKSDGWRGGMLLQELSKRNTFCLYAVKEACQDARLAQETSKSTTVNSFQQDIEHQQAQQSGGTVLGYVVVQVNSITAHVNKLAVAPNARRQGLGETLLKIAIHERRALCSTLHVDASNTPALALYRKAGFEQDGLIHDYYGAGKNAYKLIADFQESQVVAAFVDKQ